MMHEASLPSDPAPSGAAIAVRSLQAHEHARWDAFVEACPEATFFHRAGWHTIMQQGFKHDSHFLYAEQDGRIAAVLPLAHVRSRLFGSSLVSLPFCVYGGIAGGSPAVRQALDEAALALARRLGVGHLEYRWREVEDNAQDGWLHKPPVRDLPPSPAPRCRTELASDTAQAARRRAQGHGRWPAQRHRL